MSYSKLTKAELLDVVEQRDAEVLDLLARLEDNSLQSKWNTFTYESKLLGEDLLKLVKLVYELGVATRKQVDSLLQKPVVN